MRWFYSVALVLTCSCALLLGPGTAAGSVPTAPCTLGDAQKTFEKPFGNLIGSACQYRLFFDGDTYTFCEDDFILGGVVWFWEYPELGVTRAEAIADIEANEDHVWIDGSEQQLMFTAYKDGQHPVFGQVVFQHRAFITQLPVGEHTSYYENFHPDYGLTAATVTLQVLPRSDPACN